jgi:hypothetical protein
MPEKDESDVKIYIPKGTATGSTVQAPQSSPEQSEQRP